MLITITMVTATPTDPAMDVGVVVEAEAVDGRGGDTADADVEAVSHYQSRKN